MSPPPKLVVPDALKHIKLKGRENYRYWASSWYAYLKSLDMQDHLDYCRDDDKAHRMADGALLGLMLSTIEKQVLNSFSHSITDCSSLWDELKLRYEPAVLSQYRTNYP